MATILCNRRWKARCSRGRPGILLLPPVKPEGITFPQPLLSILKPHKALHARDPSLQPVLLGRWWLYFLLGELLRGFSIVPFNTQGLNENNEQDIHFCLDPSSPDSMARLPNSHADLRVSASFKELSSILRTPYYLFLCSESFPRRIEILKVQKIANPGITIFLADFLKQFCLSKLSIMYSLQSQL